MRLSSSSSFSDHPDHRYSIQAHPPRLRGPGMIGRWWAEQQGRLLASWFQ
ncbi:hypothetical protein SynBMKMC1_02373 [Synechococcus sp. BMK-MC-1]|nr:hypothetical protein SynBMKMC1_02373 [Synechococcus sp. BMK-MC-1]